MLPKSMIFHLLNRLIIVIILTMSFTIEQKVGDKVYLYEVTSYWDKEKKQARQHRKYIGKKDPHTGQAVLTQKGRSPRAALDYGQVYLLQEMARRIGLCQLLQKAFPDHYENLLALAYFEMSEAAPLYLFPYWAESTHLNSGQALSSQKLTDMTRQIGQMQQERESFIQQWIRKHKQFAQPVVFDITSLSSYSRQLSDVEWGYNRDGENLPQINLGMIYDQTSQLPLFYQIYPGSIRDVSTLKNIVKRLQLFELTDITFVLDRGFYSALNVEEMHNAGIRFIIPMPRTVNLFAELYQAHQQQLHDPNAAFAFKDEILYHYQTPATIKTVHLTAHLFFNQQLRTDQSTRFLKQLIEIETVLNRQPFQTKAEAEEHLTSHFKAAAPFLKLNWEAEKLTISRDPKSIENQVALMGIYTILTNHPNLEHQRLLQWYRQKDLLEKTFDTLKNEFDGKRLRAQSTEAVEGRMFIKFISLILHAAISKTMHEKELFKTYSIREVMAELKKLRIVEMKNGQTFLTEISKKQKHIYKTFDINYPFKT